MSTTPSLPIQNLLLAAIPNKELEILLKHCASVQLHQFDQIALRFEKIEFAYFPSNSVISLLLPIHGANGLEVGLIGNEGMLGATLVLGNIRAPVNAVVQRTGSAMRISAKQFLRALEQLPALNLVIKKYLYVLMSQLMQTVECKRFHLAEARLARLLLMLRDRAHSSDIRVTQVQLAEMLGVRRVGVTKSAGELRTKNLISYSRGKVHIHNTNGLEALACICYLADKESYSHVFCT